MRRHREVGMSVSWWRWKAETPMNAVEGRIGDYVCWRKVDIDLNKSNLKPLTKSATDTVEKTSLIMEPWCWTCDFGRDKLHTAMGKASWEAKKSTKTTNQPRTKKKKKKKLHKKKKRRGGGNQ
jgi:hypothetical protein